MTLELKISYKLEFKKKNYYFLHGTGGAQDF